MITEKRKRRKAREDDGKEIMPRIKNGQVLGGNTITNEVVKETSSKSHTDQTIHAPTDRTTLDLVSEIPTKIPTVANTAQNDRKNIDYSVAPTNKKKEMINTTHTEHSNSKRDPRAS